MGVLGVLFLLCIGGIIYYIYQFFSTALKLKTYKKYGTLGTGQIDSLSDHKIVWKNKRKTKIESQEFIYNITISLSETNKKIQTTYSKMEDAKAIPETLIGQTFDVYYDFNSQTFLNIQECKKTHSQSLKLAIACLIMLIIVSIITVILVLIST